MHICMYIYIYNNYTTDILFIANISVTIVRAYMHTNVRAYNT